METKHLKKYAPEARRDFIVAVKNKAAVYGLLPKEILPMQEEGDVVIIGDRPFPRPVAKQRNELETRIRKVGFQQFIEAIAYTWFNRFVAIRYMELHGYLDHGYRVLSHPEEKSVPEILENAERVELPGLKRDEVVDLKLDGSKDEQLYQMLLLAQCNALHKAMPFLFESIKDGTELLLPDNLLHTDSLVRTLVNDIPEDQWENVEIIGWLYQFYISEKKDEVIGKVVKSEDIPAATQLFTPNWIVKYLVQNSLGRQWMATYPDSPLKQQMEYYIEPADQTPEVQRQLDEITPDSLNPEELTLLDPACGSGHILVEAYDLFKAIYAERGYRARDIPKLILEKNLYGLEIDDRAAQLAAFALMMKARVDDRSIFERGVQSHVRSIQESKGLDAQAITESLNAVLPDGTIGKISQSDVEQLVQLFEGGKTFGSLIQVPDGLARNITSIAERTENVIAHGGMLERPVAQSIQPLAWQAKILASNYDSVVTNPPYMGSGYYAPHLKAFVNRTYASSRRDLYACFIRRNLAFCKEHASVAMITIPNWMFLSTFEELRCHVLEFHTIDSLIHNGRGVWGSDFGSCMFVISQRHTPSFSGVYVRLFAKQGSIATNEELLHRFLTKPRISLQQESFDIIPGKPIAYWISENVRLAFKRGAALGEFVNPRVGLDTGDNDNFLRLWHEVDYARIGFGKHNLDDFHRSNARYVPHTKGGEYRKWYGNLEYVLKFDSGSYKALENSGNHLPSRQFYFLEGANWTRVSSGAFSIRYSPIGCVFNSACPTILGDHNNILIAMSLLLSRLSSHFLAALSPTVNAQAGEIRKLPVVDIDEVKIVASSERLIELAKTDWNSCESSWDFVTLPIVQPNAGEATIPSSFDRVCRESEERRTETIHLEEGNNAILIDAYGLREELSPKVHDNEITLYRPECEEDIKRVLSYGIGCMMGRYSLDEEGLIYAHGGNEDFDQSRYKSFPADDDGIIPITDMAWFSDDTASRFEEFVKTVWSKEYLEENLEFVAECLDQKNGETSRDCIRRYLATGFYKHHMSMYKKRPIYWLFSSGKQRAFQCLVYLHRYNAGTLSRMRTEYVVTLQGKINARIEQLESDIFSAGSELVPNSCTTSGAI